VKTTAIADIQYFTKADIYNI